MNILHLTMKGKWFEMEACGEKKEEYREIKPYWIKRLVEGASAINRHGVGEKVDMVWLLTQTEFNVIVNYKKYNRIYAKNGYSKTSPIIHWEHLGISIGEPNPSWCEPQDVGKKVFILKIGDILYKS